MAQKKFYITTPIYYSNAAPHIGHAYATTISDIVARFRRMQDDNVFFLTGTADHGEKIARSATDAGMTPQVFTDQNVEKFKGLYGKLNISNDYFIRNSDKENHWPGAQALWEKLVESGDIYKGVYKGRYCVGCESFKTEKDLVDGKCPDHDKEPEEIEQENYFFRLSKYSKEIKKVLEEDEIRILPASRKQELLSFVNEGLQDVSFSRPKGESTWGIPVPNDPEQLMYVWCEELSNYVSALGYGREDDNNFKTFWPADIHVVGKDILRFHAIVWPAMLMSAGIPLPKKILAHGMIISDGKKMSKTIGNIIDPQELIEEYGSEALRYYLAREISPFEDSDITKEKFKETYNANLANGLGNLVARVMKMSETHLEKNPATLEKAVPEEFSALLDALEIQKASDFVWERISDLDMKIQETQPFKLVKEDKEKAVSIIEELVVELNTIGRMLNPILPDTSLHIEDAIKNNMMPDTPLFPRKD